MPFPNSRGSNHWNGDWFRKRGESLVCLISNYDIHYALFVLTKRPTGLDNGNSVAILAIYFLETKRAIRIFCFKMEAFIARKMWKPRTCVLIISNLETVHHRWQSLPWERSGNLTYRLWNSRNGMLLWEFLYCLSL